jgi:hypothetical protein
VKEIKDLRKKGLTIFNQTDLKAVVTWRKGLLPTQVSFSNHRKILFLYEKILFKKNPIFN